MAYDEEAYKGCFDNAAQEWFGELKPTSGAFPEDLEGTFFANGPGKFQINGQRFKNPFEGDGMVSAVTFAEGGGRAHFRNRFVRTKGLAKEEAAGKVLRANNRQPMGYCAAWAGSLLDRRRNFANRGVLYWGRLCLAMWDGGLPWKIDPKNLETYFQDDVKGYLRKGDKGGETMASRARVDGANNRLVIFGYDGAAKVCVREFNDKLQCGRIREDALPGGPALISDFAITERYYVFSVPKVTLDKLPYTLGLKGLDEALAQPSDAPTSIVLIPRSADTKLRPITIPADPHICWGIANAFDGDDDTVVIDMVRMDPLHLGAAAARAGAAPGISGDSGAFSYAAAVPPRRLVRYTVPVGDGAAAVQQRELCARHCDYATVAARDGARRHRYVYCGVGADAAGGSPHARTPRPPPRRRPSPIQGVCSVDTETGAESVWMAGEKEFLGAISHAPARDGDEAHGGYVIGILTDGLARSSELVVLRALDIAAGPVCRAPINGNIPPSFGAWFTPGAAAAWSPEALDKSFALANLFKRKGWNEAKSEFSSLGMNMLD
ncbi:carotenoid oxygenase [Tribonema minus]|uniref:Carotenoid oxygenase n=1 Tax=Tribonema minus TaxID=303371 RepID=A0A835ZHX0_9STRA|nr:carotenoid oxygenase [Tribonema minus]